MAVRTTEEDIIATHIDPILDAGDRTDASQTTTQEVEPASSPEPLTAQQPTQPAASGSPAPDTTAKPVATQAGARADGAQVLQDGGLKLKDGTIVQKGAPRRLYESLQTTTAELTTVKQQNEQMGEVLRRVRDEIGPNYDRQIATLTGQVDAYKAAATLPNQLQLTPDETTYAIKLIAAYKANPVQTLQFMLAEAKAQGHNLEGIGSSVDAAAISRMLDTRLAPLTADREALVAEQRVWDDAGVSARNFLNNHNDAAIHEEHIAALMDKYPDLSAEGAYYELKLGVQKRGLDWSKPLTPQLQAASAQQPADAARQPHQPLPANGRTNASGTAVATVQTTARADAEFSDIIRESMREAGLRV